MDLFGPVGPMPPMVSLPENIRCGSPSARWRLTFKDQAGHPSPNQFFQSRGLVLAPTTLRIRYKLDFVMKVTEIDRLIVMSLPPDREDFKDFLPTNVALLGFADLLRRILATQC